MLSLNVPVVAASGTALHPVWGAYIQYLQDAGATSVRCHFAANEIGRSGPSNLNTGLIDAFFDVVGPTSLNIKIEAAPYLDNTAGSYAYIQNGNASWSVSKRHPSTLNTLCCDQQQATVEYAESQFVGSESRLSWYFGHEYGVGLANGAGYDAQLDNATYRGTIDHNSTWTTWKAGVLSGQGITAVQGAHEILQAVHDRLLPLIHPDSEVITAGIAYEDAASFVIEQATLEPVGFTYWDDCAARAIANGFQPYRMASLYAQLNYPSLFGFGPKAIADKGKEIVDYYDTLGFKTDFVEWGLRQTYITDYYSRSADEQRLGQLLVEIDRLLTARGYRHSMFTFMGWDAGTDFFALLKANGTLMARALPLLRRGGYTADTAIGGGAITYGPGETITPGND